MDEANPLERTKKTWDFPCEEDGSTVLTRRTQTHSSQKKKGKGREKKEECTEKTRPVVRPHRKKTIR